MEKGDTIAFIAPSAGLSSLFPHRIENATKAIQQLGFKVKNFPTTRKFVNGRAGTVQERVADIHSAFESSEIKAIVCTIGGLYCNELLNVIDYNIIRKNPKIFCGYSDATLLHWAFFKKTGLVTFYGPAAMTQFGEFPRPFKYTIDYFLKAVISAIPIGKIEPSPEWTDEFLDWSQKKDMKRQRKMEKNKGHIWIRAGIANAPIVGGCLYSLLQLKGTVFDIDYKGKILFIETPEGQDVKKGEPLPFVDSQIIDLKNAGVFDKINGLIVGKGYGYSEQEREYFKQIIVNHTRDYDFPVLFNVNIGHADPIITLPLNVKVTLNAENNVFSIDESGVI